ncbi:MAG: AmmeMemoRadiSam system protein A [Candidatus Aegiribacteria sp.]
MISESDRKALLELAGRAVRAAAAGEPLPPVPEGEVFAAEGGAFVTLRKNGALRGCIGHFTGTGPIGRTVIDMAASAAVRDPRFPPVRPGEVDDIDLEISILSPMEPAAPEDVVPGTHGLYVRQGFRSGTLLPQVAEEEGWDRETFLAHTCLKAGLPPDSWKRDDVQLYTYTAEVFGEERKGAVDR